MSDDEVYEKYQELVYRLAVARTKQPSDADDVFQNVFYTYFKKKPKFKDEEHAKAWFIKVTINAAKKMYSRHEFTKRADMEDSDLENTISDIDFLKQVELREDIESILGKLSEDYRTVLMMRFFFGFSIEETAKHLDRSVASIKALLSRAKKQCSSLLTEEGYGHSADAENNTMRKGDNEHD